MALSLGLFFLLQFLGTEKFGHLTPEQVEIQFLDQLQLISDGKDDFSTDKRNQVVPSLELYHPFPGHREFSMYSLEFLKRIEKTSCATGFSVDSGKDQKEKKFLAWRQANCEKSPSVFNEYLDKKPYLHPSGRSYQKMAEENWGIAPNSQRKHVLERTNRDRFDAWYVALSNNAKMSFLFGEKLIVDNGDIAVNWGWLENRQRVSLINEERFWEELQALGYAATKWDVAKTCDFFRLGLCWSIQREQSLFEKYVTPTSIAVGISVFFFLASSFLLLLFQQFLGRQKLEAAHAFVFRVISHEIRTPLTSIRLYLDGLRRQYDHLNEKGQEDLMQLLQTFRDLDRVIEGSLNELRGHSDVVSCDGVDVAYGVYQKHFTDLVTWDSDLESLRVQCPEFWVSVFVKNLLSNALNHGAGEVKLTLRDSADHLVLQVEDQGKVRLSELKTYLKPFAKSKKSEGFGFGLAMVKKKVEEFGGEFEVFADPTRFVVRLRREVK